MRPVVVIVGPTAVGKSQLALHLAQRLDGEIVSADSRQIYRYMDIGTSKPSPGERALVPHHLVDITDPDQDFTLALYQEMAYQAIADVHRRGKLPFLVGGSGLYAWSVVEGWQIPKVPPQLELRQEMEARVASEGVEALYRELEEADPAAARRIDPRNVRRVIRALEVWRLAGVPFSQLGRREAPSLATLVIGLTTDRDDLYDRIDSRVDGMIEQGLVAEVRDLMERGYGLDLPSMSGLGYRQIGGFLRGEAELSAAVQQTKFETHRFARHQYAWFKLGDERIRWFDVREKVEEPITRLADSFRVARPGAKSHIA
jgi:tRNA dimethylallyltransferase